MSIDHQKKIMIFSPYENLGIWDLKKYGLRSVALNRLAINVLGVGLNTVSGWMFVFVCCFSLCPWAWSMSVGHPVCVGHRLFLFMSLGLINVCGSPCVWVTFCFSLCRWAWSMSVVALCVWVTLCLSLCPWAWSMSVGHPVCVDLFRIWTREPRARILSPSL